MRVIEELLLLKKLCHYFILWIELYIAVSAYTSTNTETENERLKLKTPLLDVPKLTWFPGPSWVGVGHDAVVLPHGVDNHPGLHPDLHNMKTNIDMPGT